MTAYTSSEAALRKEVVSATVVEYAARNYVFKDLVAVSSSNAWTETYYQETSGDLSGGTGSAVKGIPRFAQFPTGEASWTKKSAVMKKYGMEGVISWEDKMMNNIDVIARTLLKISRAVVKAVDAEIYATLSENDTPVNINTVATAAAWDTASLTGVNVIDDLMHAKQVMGEDNVDTSNLTLVVSDKDHRSLVAFLSAKGSQFPQLSTEVSTNGQIGRLAGFNIRVSNNVTADKAIIVAPKICATWKEVQPLTVVTIEDAGIKYTIRAWEEGVTQLIQPNAVCLITNTQA